MTSASSSTISQAVLAFRYALRDLVGDRRGFAIFIACIVIGVAATTGVASLSTSLSRGLAREGRTILGGDIAITRTGFDFSAQELADFQRRARVDKITLIRAMARRGDDSALVEIKAVDAASYPPIGALTVKPPAPLVELLREEAGIYGLLAEPLLIERLAARIGDVLTIGGARFALRGELRGEPDKLMSVGGFGPRVIVSEAALRASGLAQPGAILRYTARLSLAPPAGDAAVEQAANDIAAAFPQGGWEVRRRDAPSPAFARNQERFTQLLTLVALTALVAGGAGVANAVSGLIERKRRSFAILKALGASSRRVFAIALTEVMLVATLAVCVGLVLGSALPFIAGDALGALIDLPFIAAIDARGAVMGALYGLLVALVFALGPLAGAYEISVAALLRDDGSTASRAPRRFLVARFGVGAALVAAVLAASTDLTLTASYLAATVAAVLFLRGVAAVIVRATRVLPRPKSQNFRLALANIGRPRGLAPALIVSIGLTQTLLVALALVEGAIHLELARPHADQIPRYYFIDVPQNDAAAFERFLLEKAPHAHVQHVPMMRGRITAVKGVPAERLKVSDDVAWALQGDRGVTFSSAPPSNSQVVAGEWWSADRVGPPLISLEQRVAEGLQLAIGDEVTVNVLGRDVVARIANLRKVDWRSFAINFAMVFSPGSFPGAPYSELFTAAYGGKDADAVDIAILRETAKRFPVVAAIRVREALEAADKVATQLGVAARVAAGVAIATAMLALASAVAASQSQRLHDAVVLKVLGATRRRLALIYALEFGVLGLVASLFATLAGSAAAYAMVTRLMKLDFTFPPETVAATALVSLLLTIVLGLAATWRVLAQKPASALRSL